MPDEKDLFERHIRPLAPLAAGMVPRLAGMRPFAAMMFDVYGTLLVSAAGDIDAGEPDAARVQSLAEVCRRHGIRRPVNEVSEMLREAVDREHHRLRRRGVDYPEVDILRLWQEVLGFDDPQRTRAFALEFELVVNPVWEMPGAGALLAACRSRQVPMGIVSNAQAYTPDLLEWILGASLGTLGFDGRLLFYSYRCGRAKPSPAMFAQAAEALEAMGIPAAATLYVGNDMLKDILPAHGAGFATALFAGDRRSLRLRQDHPRCRHLSPDLLVTDLRQLMVATLP